MKTSEDGLLDAPRIEPWMQKAVIDFRQRVSGQIAKFIDSQSAVFGELKDLKVFAQGSWSCVFKATTTSGVHIFKTTPRVGVLKREAFFMKCWQEAGITVPNIRGVFQLDKETNVLVMEYVPSPTFQIAETTIGLRPTAYQELGEVMAQTHQVAGQGFGNPCNEDMRHGEYENFEDYLRKDLFGNTQSLKSFSRTLPIELDQIITNAVDCLVEVRDSSLCHFDIHGLNVFYTKPLTIFDPNPTILPPIIDLANTLFMTAANWNGDLSHYYEIEKGYSKLMSINWKHLKSALGLVALNKLPLWEAKGKVTKVEFALQMFKSEFHPLLK